MYSACVERDIALVLDTQDAGRRAIAAAALAAGSSFFESGQRDPSEQMYGFYLAHEDALPWDGRGVRSGTITYVDAGRVEQYVGQQRWIAYRPADLAPFRPDVGDQLRIGMRAAVVSVEAIGPNRLAVGMSSVERSVSSGLLVLRTTEFDADEIIRVAGAVAERFRASVDIDETRVRLDFRGAALLDVLPALPQVDWVEAAAALAGEPIAGTIRLAVTVRTTRLEAALDVERALMLCAAMLAGEAPSVTIDDTGSVFSTQQLYELATQSGMRADAFTFAAAAAQRALPADGKPFFDRAGAWDELIVFSSRPWRAEFAATLVERAVDGLTDAARLNDDPVIPDRSPQPDNDNAPGEREQLVQLAYGMVKLDVAFLDLTQLKAERAVYIDERKDIAVLLGGPPLHAILITYGTRDGDSNSGNNSVCFALEMRRANTLATALAAEFARRGGCVAADAAGTLYSADDLFALALRRCGTRASWNAHVAAVHGKECSVSHERRGGEPYDP